MRYSQEEWIVIIVILLLLLGQNGCYIYMELICTRILHAIVAFRLVVIMMMNNDSVGTFNKCKYVFVCLPKEKSGFKLWSKYFHNIQSIQWMGKSMMIEKIRSMSWWSIFIRYFSSIWNPFMPQSGIDSLPTIDINVQLTSYPEIGSPIYMVFVIVALSRLV